MSWRAHALRGIQQGVLHFKLEFTGVFLAEEFLRFSTVLLWVDMFITSEPEVWIAPQNTFRVVKIRSLVEKISKQLVQRNTILDESGLLGSITFSAEDFFMAANPQMGWRPDRETLAPLTPPAP